MQAFTGVLRDAITTSLEEGLITETCGDRLQRLAHKVRQAVLVRGRNLILGQGPVVLAPGLRSLGTQTVLGRLISRRHVLQYGPHCSLRAWHIVLVAPRGVPVVVGYLLDAVLGEPSFASKWFTAGPKFVQKSTQGSSYPLVYGIDTIFLQDFYEAVHSVLYQA